MIPNGIGLSKFYNCEVSDIDKNNFYKKYNLTDDNKLIVFVGRLGEEKSIDVLINNFKKINQNIPETRLLIVGEGPLKKQLFMQAEKLNLRDKVVFTGYLK